jgi:hypothetical protein
MLVAVFITSALCQRLSSHEEKSFIAHMRHYNLLYTGDEYYFRLGVFVTNQRCVRHNSTLGMNSLSTLTPSEYLRM